MHVHTRAFWKNCSGPLSQSWREEYSAHLVLGPSVGEWGMSPPFSPLDSLVMTFTQTSTMKKADMMRMTRITMATATTTPMMTAVSTPAGPGGGGGERHAQGHTCIWHWTDNGWGSDNRLLQCRPVDTNTHSNVQTLVLLCSHCIPWTTNVVVMFWDIPFSFTAITETP